MLFLFFYLRCRYEAAQYTKPHFQNLDLSNFLFDNLQLFGFLILGYLLITVLTAILPKLVHANCRSPLKSLKLILCRALFIDHSRLPSVHLRLIFLFFSLFLFFNLNFLGGAIRTDQVTVPTDEIVDSPAKLVGTSKKLVVTKIELELIMTAPEGSFLRKLNRKFFFLKSIG